MKPSIGSVTIGVTALKLQDEELARKTWLTENGDGISLYFFDKPPNIPTGITSSEQLCEAYLAMLKASATKLVSVGVATVAECRAVRLIVKAPQKPSGMIYVGSITIPFRDFSFVLKAQCAEQGMTGIREAILFDKLRRAGTVTVSRASSTGIAGDWNPDDERYDADFPKHPLSRLRRILREIEGSCAVDASTRMLPGFALP